MFSNHHEIMLILIFTSKLPREGGELFFKKNQPYSMSIPIKGKHLSGAPEIRITAGNPLRLRALGKALPADIQGPLTPSDPITAL